MIHPPDHPQHFVFILLEQQNFILIFVTSTDAHDSIFSYKTVSSLKTNAILSTLIHPGEFNTLLSI